MLLKFCYPERKLRHGEGTERQGVQEIMRCAISKHAKMVIKNRVKIPPNPQAEAKSSLRTEFLHKECPD